MYPLLMPLVGVLVGLLTLFCEKLLYQARAMEDVEKALKGGLVISTVSMKPVVWASLKVCLPNHFNLALATRVRH